MLKKKLISLFVAITLVLTTCLPSVTFATNNDAQTETMEEVSETNEEVPEVTEEVPEVDEEGLEEESVHCVECDSENVSLLVPLLNLYHCEDCGKYFTVGTDTNKKTVSEQVSAVEEDAKKEANEAIFGINNSIIVTYIIFQNNKNQGTKAYTYDDRDTATYPEINDTGVFGELTTEFPGWIFKGYATTATGPVVYKPGDKVVAKRLFTVYEKETYKVNVYKNDVDDGKGVLLDSAEFEYGGEYVYEKEEPTREGYVFLGWSEDKDAVEPECTSLEIDKVTKSVDYYAIWRQEFGIKYPGLELEKYEKGSDVVLKDTFDDKKGYTLEGWSEEEGAIEVVFELGATIENIDRPYNLYPVYLPIDCDITVGDETSTVKYDSEFTLPETYEEKEGYTFVGFETTSEDYKDKYDKGEAFTVKGNATFTPVYEAKGIEVKFIINGEVYKTVEVKYDSKLNKPAEPEVAHYTFDGWFADEDLTEEFNFDEIITVTEGFNVYAKLDADKFDIKFDTDGGTEIEKVNLSYGDKLAKPEDPEKKGHTFEKWTLDGADYDFDSIVEKAFTLKAVYTVNKYEVKVGDNETTLEEYGTEYTLPDTYEIEDFTKKFVGFKDQDGKTYNPGEKFTVPDKNMTFEVITKDKDRFTVKFFDGNIEFADKKLTGVVDGTKVSAPVVEKVGHTFVNWYEDKAFNKAFDFNKEITKNTEVYAKFDVNSYEVKVGDNDATLEKYGTEYTLPNTYNISDNTKKLAGFKDQDGKAYNPGEKFIVPDKNMTFTVVTKDKDKFTVEFYDDNNEFTDKKLVNVIDGTKVSAPVVEKVGHTFVNWYEDKAFNKTFDFNKEITKNTKVYAKFDVNEYTIKVGNVETKAKFGTVFTLPNEYEVEYTKVFEGFKEEEGELRGLGYKFDVPAHDVTFDVVTRDKAKYEVHFYDENTEYDELALLDVYEGETIELPTVSKTDFIFKGWYEDKALNNKFDNANTIEKTMNLYAKFEENTVTVEIEGQEKQTVNKGSVITLPSTFTVTFDEVKFTGWRDQDNKKYSPSQKVTINKDMRFYAVIENKKYYSITYYDKIKYSSGDFFVTTWEEWEPYAEVLIREDKATQPIDNLKKSGHTLVSWQDKDGNDFTFGGNLTADIELYSNWKVNTYTVKYDANGGSGVPTSFVKTYGKNVTLATPIAPDGYLFYGWYKDKSFNYASRFDGSTDLTTENGKTFTIYARWERKEYTVKYDAQGGSVSPGQFTKQCGIKVSLATPTRAGYTFGGWYKESGCTNKYDGNSDLTTTPYATVTIYAKWAELSYTISYNLDGGSWSGSAGKTSRKYTEEYVIPTNVTKTGYRFDGWTSNGSKITKLLGGNTNTYTLKAKWVKTYKVVTYYLNKVVDGTYYYSWNERIYDENASYVVPSGVNNNNTVYHYLSRDGKNNVEQEYYFEGFTADSTVKGFMSGGEYTNGTVSSTYKDGFTVTSDVNLYAVYSAKEDFVCDCHIGSEGSKDSAVKYLKEKGYPNYIDYDLNRKAGGKWIYLGYTKTTNPTRAIKNIIAYQYKNSEHTYDRTVNGVSYRRISNTHSSDLNREAGGKYVYIYGTKDYKAGAPVKVKNFKVVNSVGSPIDWNTNYYNVVHYMNYQTAFSASIYYTPTGNGVVDAWNHILGGGNVAVQKCDAAADLNLDAGGDYIYLNLR